MAKRQVVVDGANVAYEERSKSGTPRLANLVGLRKDLEDRGFAVIMIVDASLYHEIDDPDQLDALIDNGTIHQAPAGTEADYFVLKIADENNALVVSNDRFQQYQDEYPWIEKRRIPYMIVEHTIHLHEPDLQKAG